MFKVYLLTGFLLYSICSLPAFSEDRADTLRYLNQNFTEYGYSIYPDNPQKAEDYFTEGLHYFKSRKDTSSYLYCKIALSDLERRKGHYNRAFDVLWEVQKEAETLSNRAISINIHKRFGMLYGIYGKDSLSLLYHQMAVTEAKKSGNQHLLNPVYFELAQQYVAMKQYDRALSYLDSSYLSNPGNNRLIYVDALYGHIYTHQKAFHKARIYLEGLLPLFEKANRPYLAKVNLFVAGLHLAENQPDSAIYYYNRSLQVIDNMKVHFEIKPTVLEALAGLHYQKGDLKNAYACLSEHKAITDSLFHTQSRQNSELFEMKTSLGKDLDLKEKQLIAQQQMLELQKKADFRLKLISGILILLVTIVWFTLWQRLRMKKMATDKIRNDALLEIKNKELTANALQFIEKENTFNELLEVVETHAPEKFRSLTYKTKQSNKRIWEDFHLRFTQINSTFYDKLRKLHPDLTPTDLKHCALVRLNFDSKEMAIILGISLHGVHTARSRIRKKIGLNREDGLAAYLGNI